MTDHPAPLSPPECDLRDYAWMPLLGAKLFQSKFYAHATDAEFRTAMHLWWSSWQECPAGSLPNDDRQLAVLAGFGRDVKGWAKVKEMALHGFILCADGRLYHPLIAEEAVKAFDLKLKHDKKRETDRKRLQDWRDAKAAKRASKQQSDDDGNGGPPSDETGDETPPDTTDETRFTTRVETQNVALRPDQTRPDNKPLTSFEVSRTPARDAEFEQFWQGYPRKVGKDAARKAYANARKRADHDAILAGMARQSWPNDPQFIPHPATWLQQGRWQDDPGAAAPAAVPSREQPPLRESRRQRIERELGLAEEHDHLFRDPPPEPKGLLQ